MKSPNPEVIIKLAQELKEAKAAVAILQARWDGYFGLGNGEVPAAPKKGGRRFEPDSTTGRIIAKLEEDRARDYDKDEMGKALGIDAKKAERTLIKLSSANRISRAGRGRYCAKKMEIAA
jgi:hypothetical protein